MESAVTPANHHPRGHHEHKEADVRLVLIATGILIVVIIAACFVAVGVFNWLNTSPPEAINSAIPVNPNPAPPVPRVLEHPWEELPEVHAHENQILYSYGWVDKANGVVRVPIGRAMDMLLAKGLPVTPTETTKPAKASAAKATVTKAVVKQDVAQ